jgi:hypothetical protein
VFVPTAFLGHSFAEVDKPVVDSVFDTLGAIGISVVTGQRPEADRISEKIKGLIDAQYFFVGIFSRRDKIARRQEWHASTWIIEEKVYAATKGKRLILLKENGVTNIGAIQGDYEYFEFSRDRLQLLPIAVIRYFDISTRDLRGGQGS